MTTIAFKDGIMASDSCVTCDAVHIASMIKVHRTPHNALIGQAGDADCRAVFALLDKVKSSKDLPSKQEISACQSDFEVLMAFPNGDIWFVGCNEDSGRFAGYCYPANTTFAATGSGWKFAMAAMKCGRTAREAVMVACEFDRLSKLPVHTLSFEPKTITKKPKPKPK